MPRIFVFFLFYGMCFSFSAKAQVALKYVYPSASKNGELLPWAFAGGLNSPQFNEVDLDHDEDMDLVIFDRASDMIICYENKGSAYELNSNFSTYFPRDLQHWVVFADYDCDGDNDLFTAADLGVRLFRNEGLIDATHWELEADPLKTQGISAQVNVFFNPTDIPSIADLDGDGDLDFLYFNFANGDQIEFHKNYGTTEDGVCGLALVRESAQYGAIEVCDCDEFEFQGESCHHAMKTLHTSGKALLSYDQNGDGILDLVTSQEGCPNLNFLPNTGTVSSPAFEGFVNTFPTFNSLLNMPTFPAAYSIDVTFDGQKDLLIAQNVREDDHGEVDFTQSSFLFENKGNNEFDESRLFLQDQMIDVGAATHPAFVDVNGDGLDDLVLAHDQGKMTCYLQTSNGFEFYADDLFGLSGLGYTNYKIQFVNLNSDGKEDLVLGAYFPATFGNLFLYFLNQSEGLGVEIAIDDPQSFDFALDTNDDFFLNDMNADGKIDLLIGNVFGELNYFRNTGNYQFVLETSNMLGDVSNAQYSNLSISVGDLDEDGKFDLLTTRRNGELSVYFDFPNNVTESVNQIVKFENVEALETTHFGRKSKPTLGRVGGHLSAAVGTLQGGVMMLEASAHASALVLDVFPNPSWSQQVNFKISKGAGHLQIVDLAGKPVSGTFEISYLNTLLLDLSFLKPGIYLAQVLVNGERKAERIKIVTN